MELRKILPIGVVAALALVPATAASAAKPGPGALPARPGAVALDNTQLLKGASPAGPSSILGGKSPGNPVSTDVNGYTIVNTVNLANPNGQQSVGEVNCPTGTVALGGGVYGTSPSVNQSVNGSSPYVLGGVATGWVGFMDNSTGVDASFSVWAVCAKKPKTYAVVSLDFTNWPHSQTSASVQCPAGPTGKLMKVLGGGGGGASTGLLQNLNTTIPVAGSKSWRIDINNADSIQQAATVYAICGSGSGWAVSAGPTITNTAGTQGAAYLLCAPGLSVVGGGIYSSSSSVNVNVNGTWPYATNEWGGYENNAMEFDASMAAYGVCLL
jgi:hypothetical protein